MNIDQNTHDAITRVELTALIDACSRCECAPETNCYCAKNLEWAGSATRRNGHDAMILLYRSPNVTIDAADWHVTVSQSGPNNRPITRFLWRAGTGYWHAVTEWPGPMPKGLRRYFRTYERSINTAIASARVTKRRSVYQEREADLCAYT